MSRRRPDLGPIPREAKSARRKRDYIRRDDLPIYEHERFRCPECAGLEFRVKSHRDPDGVSTQLRTCLNADCGHRFILIVN